MRNALIVIGAAAAVIGIALLSIPVGLIALGACTVVVAVLSE